MFDNKTARSTLRQDLSKVGRRRSKSLPCSAGRAHPWYGLETLEQRQMLSGSDPTESVFAQFRANLPPVGPVFPIVFTVSAEDFTLAGGKVALGFRVVPDYPGDRQDPDGRVPFVLDPKAPIIFADVDGRALPADFASDSIPGRTESVSVVFLKAGTYSLYIGAEHNTFGNYRVDVFLAGDANGDGQVDQSDLSRFNQDQSKKKTGDEYHAADSNLNGKLDDYDLSVLKSNQGDATTIQRLFIGAKYQPPPTGMIGVTPVTNQPPDSLIGQTVAGLTVELDLDNDGFGDGTTVAGVKGGFGFPMNLKEGLNPVRLWVSDTFGQFKLLKRPLIIDTGPPVKPTVSLDPNHDSGEQGDWITTFLSVSLIGKAEAGTTVALVDGSRSTVADKAGNYRLENVRLELGENNLVIESIDAAKNHSQPVSIKITREAPLDSAEIALAWNTAMLQAIRLSGNAPPRASRAMAMTSAAMYDAVNAINGTSGAILVRLFAVPGASAEGAAAQAAHDMLVALYPAQAEWLDQTLADTLASLEPGKSLDDGLAIGAQVAAAIFALRASDGAYDWVDYTPGSGIGEWQPTAPVYAPPLDPNWATLQTFAMESPEQFRPDGPYPIGSAEYAKDYNEIEPIGRSDSKSRTHEQTEIARFWTDGQGTSTPPGHWNQIATAAARTEGMSLFDTTRLLAQLNVGMADAAIVAWDAKYTFGSWRPFTAIAQGDLDDNPNTAGEWDWSSLLITPPFPDYISGHSTFSGVADRILSAQFGESYAFEASADGLLDIKRQFESFAEAAEEASVSRVYGGIHFRKSCEDGLAAGRELGDWLLAHFADQSDTVAPVITVASPARDSAHNELFEVKGRVVDGLSTVASLTVQIDGGTIKPVAFDPKTGEFTTKVNLAGKADGPHTLRIRATDGLGNQSKPFEHAFIWDTGKPLVTVDSPQPSEKIMAGAAVTGSVATGAANTARVTYNIDGGIEVPISFDATSGQFSQALDLSLVNIGKGHKLEVTATDAAGNTASSVVQFELPALIPMEITALAPAPGSSDVGVTQRPRVDFSRPVKKATLNGESFFLSFAGQKLPATVVISDDGMFAWLFPTVPMPGATQIRLTLNGDLIKAETGKKLDADGDGSPGGVREFTFTTVGTYGLPEDYDGTTRTSISGVVLDPWEDLIPYSFDDARAGPDQVLMTADDKYLHPLEGVEISVLGRADLKTLTDKDGKFSLVGIPSGDVKLVVNGRTAIGPPVGIYFPEMVMDLSVLPAQANTVMDAMMRASQNRATEDFVPGIHLPRLEKSILQEVDGGQTTEIGVNVDASPDLPEEQRAALKMTVAKGSLVGSDGKELDGAQIGISMVPAQLVRDMLPPGVLQNTYNNTMTIQATGVGMFTTPAAITLPNTFGAAPGTKLNLISFDHTTGRLELEGTMTVSADGTSVTTDPGGGITHPGWHWAGAGVNGFGQVIQPRGDCDLDDLIQKVEKRTRDADLAAYSMMATATGVIPGIGQSALLYNAGVAAESLYTWVNDPLDMFLGVRAATNVLSLVPGPIGLGFSVASIIFSAIDFKSAQDDIDLNMNLLHLYTDYCAGPKSPPDAANDANMWLRHLLEVQQPDYATIIDTGPQVVQILEKSLAGDQLTLSDLERETLAGLLPPLMSALYSLGQQEFLMDATESLHDADIAAIEYLMNGLSRPSANASVLLTSNGQEFRIRTDGTGHWAFVLPERSLVKGHVLDAQSLSVASFGALTGAAGSSKNFGVVYIGSTPDGPDDDEDQLTDEGESVVGTRADLADTDGDGLLDGAEIRAGLDPLSGLPATTGILGSLILPGPANEVVVDSSVMEIRGQTAYIAGGAAGLAIVDASDFMSPLLLGTLALPGTAVDVSVDSHLRIVALASGVGGLHLVDVTDPGKPTLIRTIDLDATQVEVFEGIVYAAVGGSLRAYDLITGDELQALTLGGGTIKALAREGSMLYSVDSGLVLRAVDISKPAMAIRGILQMPAGGRRLFVGGGIAYVATNTEFDEGFATANVSDPDNMIVLSGVDDNKLAGRAVVSNGSGLGIAIGRPKGAPMLDLLNVTDPSQTGLLLTRFALPALPVSVTIASGIAFVACGEGGLQVVNYRSFDNKGVPPVVDVDAEALDTDPNKAGIQVVEGSTIVPRLATLFDDVQVRNVEVLIDGEVVLNDISFPFDTRAIAPLIIQGKNTATLQVRATDTGGNATLTDPIILKLIPDTVAPQLLQTSPTDGSRKGEGLRALTLLFNEAMDAESLSHDSVYLVDPNGEITAQQDIQFRYDDTFVQVAYEGLTPGSWKLVLAAKDITDRAGNKLGKQNLVIGFEVVHYTIRWITPGGGDWGTPANWDTGMLPGPDDIVLIDEPGGATVTHGGQATTSIRALIAESPLTIYLNRTLVIAEASSARSMTLEHAYTTLTVNGALLAEDLVVNVGGNYYGHLNGSGDVTVTGKLTWKSGTMDGAGKTVIASGGELEVSGTAPMLKRVLENIGTATWTSGQFQFSGGTFLNQGDFIAAGENLSTGGGNGTFTNNGTFTKTLPGTVTLQGLNLYNNGVMTMAAGSWLNLWDSGGVYTGRFDGLGSVQFGGYGTHTFKAGSVLAVGSTHVEGPTMTVEGILDVQTLSMSGGYTTLDVAGSLSVADWILEVHNLLGDRVIGAGDIDVTKKMTWYGGTMAGTGRTIIAKGATLELAAGVQYSAKTLGRTMENNGTATWTSGQFQFSGGTFLNQGDFIAAGENLSTGGGSGTFTNNGEFKKTGNGSVLFESAGFNNTVFATVKAEGGVLNFYAGFASNAGTIHVSAGSQILINKNFENTATGLIDLDLGGADPSQYGRFSVSNIATLGGTFSLNLVNDYIPKPEDPPFTQLFTYGSRKDGSEFNAILLPELDVGKWSYNYGDNGFELDVI